MADQVFISYAHADDVPMDEEAIGWVSCFVDKLKRSVGMQPCGGNIECWMDHRLEPQRQVDDELRRKIRGSKVIVAFISPRYFESDWCPKEMKTFVDLVGGKVDGRVFLVEIRPTNRKDWHPGVSGLTEVRFWTTSLTQPEAIPLGWPLPNIKGDRKYWRDIDALAAILARQIKGLEPETAQPPIETQLLGPLVDDPVVADAPLPVATLFSPSPAPATTAPRTVWIADPTDDVDDEWQALRQWLLDLGHNVLPAQSGTYRFHEESQLRKALDGDLQRADLLLQLLGLGPGRKPAWSEQRIVPFQTETARRAAATRHKNFLIWRAPHVVPEEVGDAAYRALVEGADARNMQTFRQHVHALLMPPVTPARHAGVPLSVLINADEDDRHLGQQAQDILDELNVDTTLIAQPDPTQPPAAYRQQLDIMLEDSNGVLIVYGATRPTWVQTQVSAARKILAQKRKGIWTGVLECPPEHKLEHGVRAGSLMTLDCRHGIERAPLARFVDALRAENGHV